MSEALENPRISTLVIGALVVGGLWWYFSEDGEEVIIKSARIGPKSPRARASDAQITLADRARAALPILGSRMKDLGTLPK